LVLFQLAAFDEALGVERKEENDDDDDEEEEEE
jgi:hypothetical protein